MGDKKEWEAIARRTLSTELHRNENASGRVDHKVAIPFIDPADAGRVITDPRYTPIRHRGENLEALQRIVADLEKEGVIKQVTGTDKQNMRCLSPVFGVRQGNKTRMVLNVFHLNTRCKLSTYPSRLIPEILAKERGVALIAKLDGRAAYHQLQVSDDDSRFLGFELANKTYRFKRLPFGVKFAPGDFQRWIETEFVGSLPNTHAYFDDVLVFT